MMKAARLAKLGIMTACALILSYIEHLVPVFSVPGVKIGLANVVVLFAVYTDDIPGAVIIVIIKTLLAGALYSGVTGMLYSLAGGVLSLLVMLAAKHFLNAGPLAASVWGAVFHNLGQLLVACLMISVEAVTAYAPILMLTALLMGAITGICARCVLRSGLVRKKEKENDA